MGFLIQVLSLRSVGTLLNHPLGRMSTSVWTALVQSWHYVSALPKVGVQRLSLQELFAKVNYRACAI